MNTFDYQLDFWTPENKVLFPLDLPSSLMWAYVYYYHLKSPTSHLPPRLRLLSSQKIDPSFVPDDTLIPYFTTKNSLLLHNWENKLHERDLFIKSLPYDASNYKMLDAMLEATSLMWKQYLQILSLIDKDGTESKLSLLEQYD